FARAYFLPRRLRSVTDRASPRPRPAVLLGSSLSSPAPPTPHHRTPGHRNRIRTSDGGRGGWGRGVASPEPWLLRMEAPHTRISWPVRGAATANAGACSGEGAPRPRPPRPPSGATRQ